MVGLVPGVIVATTTVQFNRKLTKTFEFSMKVYTCILGVEACVPYGGCHEFPVGGHCWMTTRMMCVKPPFGVLFWILAGFLWEYSIEYEQVRQKLC